jgi:hypothetical protein
MTKYKPSARDIREIADLVSGGNTDVNSAEVINSSFYRNTQSAAFLDMHDIIKHIRELPETLLLMAQIAAKSPTLEIVDLTRNDLCERGPAVAEALAKSHSIHTVGLGQNNLGEYGIAVAMHLAASSSMKKVDLLSNNLGEHGIAVVQALAQSHSIDAVILKMNHLGKHGIEVARALAASKIHTVDMGWNELGEHGIEVARALTASGAMRNISMAEKWSDPHIIEAINIIFRQHNHQHNQQIEEIRAFIESEASFPLPRCVRNIVAEYADDTRVTHTDTFMSFWNEVYHAGEAPRDEGEDPDDDAWAQLGNAGARHADGRAEPDLEDAWTEVGDLAAEYLRDLGEEKDPDDDDARAQSGDANAGPADGRAEPHLEDAWTAVGDHAAEDRRDRGEEKDPGDDDARAQLGNAPAMAQDEGHLVTHTSFSFLCGTHASTPLTGCASSE